VLSAGRLVEVSGRPLVLEDEIFCRCEQSAG
jgi:hypothetical protein